jgi:hypothetical protein
MALRHQRISNNTVYRHTTKCLVCGKTATCHHGHVMKDKEQVLAGWCGDHRDGLGSDETDRLTCRMLGIRYQKGRVGKWLPEFGVREDNATGN